MKVPADPSVQAVAQPIPPGTVRRARRRRPTGEPPPLPHHVQTSGVRWLIAALVLVAAGSGLTVFMGEAWQLVLLWGVIVGVGTGSMSMALVATITSRWFVARRGLVSGVLTDLGFAEGGEPDNDPVYVNYDLNCHGRDANRPFRCAARRADDAGAGRGQGRFEGTDVPPPPTRVPGPARGPLAPPHRVAGHLAPEATWTECTCTSR